MTIRNFTIFKFVLVITAIFVFLSGCERVPQVLEPTTPPVKDSSEQISIGLVLPLTGRHAAAFGEPMLRALQIALREINHSQLAGSNLKFIIQDSRSTAEGAVEAYEKLIHEDKVSVILGPATSTATKETFPIAKENQVVAISPTSAARGLSAISDYVFRIALTTDRLVPNGIEATHAKLSYQKVATLYDETDEFSIDGDAALQEALTAKGVIILGTETFRGGETDDFSTQLTRIKALNPDAIFVSSLPPEKPQILLKGHELGIAAPFIIRTLTETDVEAAGEAAEGAITFVGWGTMIDTPGNQRFVQEYGTCQPNEKCIFTGFVLKPNNYAARSYAALYILAKAIANAESSDASAIRDALANISNFDTILGKFSFDENGDAVYDPKILIVKDGKLELFD